MTPKPIMYVIVCINAGGALTNPHLWARGVNVLALLLFAFLGIYLCPEPKQ